MSKPCTICALPARKRNQVDRALVAGKTYDWIASHFSSAERKVSRSIVFRHSRHALAPPKGRRLHTDSRVPAERPSPTPTPTATGPAKSLIDRVEGLIVEVRQIANEAKTEGQFISALSALRELRANLELLGKLSGEISSANINFFAIEITKERALEFLLAAEKKDDVIEYMRGQFGQRFGLRPPNLVVNFVTPPAKEGDVPPAPRVVPVETNEDGGTAY